MFKLYRKFKNFLRKELNVVSPTHAERPIDVEACVCCGRIIPEGRQVCPNCEWKVAK